MAGQTLRSLIVSVSAETSAYQREMARAGRMGQNYLRTITSGNRDATNSWRSQEAAVRAQGSAMQSLTSTVGSYAAAMAGALAVGNVIHQADAWNQVNARLKQATSGTEDFTVSQKSLFDISQRTGTAFSDNANLFSSPPLRCGSLATQQAMFLASLKRLLWGCSFQELVLLNLPR